MDGIIILMYIYAFVIGSCIASFMNVVIYRVPNHLGFVKGRSFCPKCHNTLKPYDMIPVFSWLILKGKCRFCGSPISIRYPLVELSGGLIAMLLFHHYGFSWMFPFAFAISMILLAVALVDHDTMEIPNGFILFLVGCGIISLLINTDLNVFERIIGILIGMVPMMLVNVVVADSFGGGDIKLMGSCGFLLGWKLILLALFIGIVFAGVYAISLILRKKVGKSDHIAFGPYLCMGIMISMLYGESLINMYLSIFF